MNRLRPDQKLKVRTLTGLRAETIRLPDPDRIVHLQFRRFAGCPICNLHLRSIARGHEEIVAAGIREIVVFHTTASEMSPHQSQLPFAVIADPSKHLYREFGVESSPRAVLDPRSWLTAMRSLFYASMTDAMKAEGGRMGLPADFLIASDGRILALKYGKHAADQWSVDELIEIKNKTRA